MDDPYTIPAAASSASPPSQAREQPSLSVSSPTPTTSVSLSTSNISTPPRATKPTPTTATHAKSKSTSTDARFSYESSFSIHKPITSSTTVAKASVPSFSVTTPPATMSPSSSSSSPTAATASPAAKRGRGRPLATGEKVLQLDDVLRKYSPDQFKVVKAYDVGGVNILNKKPVDSKAALDKIKRRRETHNRVERRRRDCINQLIDELTALLPKDHGDSATKGHRVNVLRTAVAHIQNLTQHNEDLQKQLEAIQTGEPSSSQPPAMSTTPATARTSKNPAHTSHGSSSSLAAATETGSDKDSDMSSVETDQDEAATAPSIPLIIEPSGGNSTPPPPQGSHARRLQRQTLPRLQLVPPPFHHHHPRSPSTNAHSPLSAASSTSAHSHYSYDSSSSSATYSPYSATSSSSFGGGFGAPWPSSPEPLSASSMSSFGGHSSLGPGQGGATSPYSPSHSHFGPPSPYSPYSPYSPFSPYSPYSPYSPGAAAAGPRSPNLSPSSASASGGGGAVYPSGPTSPGFPPPFFRGHDRRDSGGSSGGIGSSNNMLPSPIAPPSISAAPPSPTGNTGPEDPLAISPSLRPTLPPPVVSPHLHPYHRPHGHGYHGSHSFHLPPPLAPHHHPYSHHPPSLRPSISPSSSPRHEPQRDTPSPLPLTGLSIHDDVDDDMATGNGAARKNGERQEPDSAKRRLEHRDMDQANGSKYPRKFRDQDGDMAMTETVS